MPPGRLGLPAGSVLRRWLADFRVRLLGEEDVGDVCPWIPWLETRLSGLLEAHLRRAE